MKSENTTLITQSDENPREETINDSYEHGVMAHIGSKLTWADLLGLEVFWGAACLIALPFGATLPWGAGAVILLLASLGTVVWHSASLSPDEKAKRKQLAQTQRELIRNKANKERK